MADAEISFQVRGGREFKAAATELRAAGHSRRLVKYINDELQRAGKPAVIAARRNALAILPKKGGLAALVASADMKVSVRSTGARAGVRIPATKRGMTQLADIDRGRVRHPVFNMTRAEGGKVFVSQALTPHWFTDPMRAQAAPMRDAVFRAIDKLIGELGG